MKFFQKFWYKLTRDLQILQMITGVPLDLERDIPRMTAAPRLIFSEEETVAADAEIA